MRKRLFILGVALFSSVNFISAQITFQKTYGGAICSFAYSGVQTTDGGYILLGSTNSFGAGNWDVYFIRTNVNGDTLWTKTYGGTGYEEGYSVQQTTDGGFIGVGSTNNSFGAGGVNVYLIKTDAVGDTLWSKTLGGSWVEYGYSIQQTTDGGYIIAGVTGFGADNNVYLIKTDAAGNLLWSKTYGGTNYDWGNSVQQTNDGGYIITGRTLSFGTGATDVYLIKTDVIGDTLWTKVFGGTGNDAGNSVQQTTDGGYIITGSTAIFAVDSSDVYLIKTNVNGDTLWTKTFGGIGDELGSSVQQTADGGYIITGKTNSFGAGDYDVYLIKTDVNGDTLWTKTFGGTYSDYGNSVQQITNGGYIIAGVTNSFGNQDVYLIKADSLGNSGCNQGSPATIVTSTPTQVISPATIVSSPVTVVTTPNTIVGSGGVVNTLCTSLVINEITANNLFILSPNPTEGNFTISFQETIVKGNIEVLNILGKNVFTENIFNESKKGINLKNISDGIYFVKVFDGEKYYCKKIIIEQN